MNETTINRLLAAFLAVVVALRADIGTVPLEGDGLACDVGADGCGCWASCIPGPADRVGCKSCIAG